MYEEKVISRDSGTCTVFRDVYKRQIRNCVARDIREGKDQTIDELVATLQKLMK